MVHATTIVMANLFETKYLLREMNTYHETISKDLNPGVPQRRRGKFKITKVAGKDLCGHRHNIINKINKNSWCSQQEKESELNPCGGADTAEEWHGGV